MALRLGVIQNRPQYLDTAANLKACFALMDKHQADLWVLPEFFASGYHFKTKAEARKCAETSDGPLVALLKAYAAKNDCAIVAGFPEKAGTKLYNSAVLAQGGKSRIYRKTHLFGGEIRFFTGGDTGFWTEKVKGVSIGVMVCFDWFFPESARTLALKGAQIIAHPSNLVLPWAPEGMKIRSLENRVFSATADRVGAERGLRFIGQSQVVAPNGELYFRLSREQEQAAVISIDAWTAKDKRVHPDCDLFADRRPRFYAR